jgi:GAF domain-containing protein
VSIPDAYEVDGFDFTGTRAFDGRTGYRSRSFLTVPLKNAAGSVLGVLQLINAQDPLTGQVVPFDAGVERMVNALSSLAALALETYVREQALRRQVERLRIEVDAARQERQVAEITETDYFLRLQERARTIREIGA